MDYNNLSNTSRVWIYQSNEPFSNDKLPQLKAQIQHFVKNWVSHNNQLAAYGDVYHNHFIVLMVDESRAGASGCSIDASVHFLKQLEQVHQVDLFDRMNFAYQQEGTVKTANRDEFAQLYQSGVINDETLVYDTLVKNKATFEEQWLKPLGESWHKRRV